MERRTIVNLVPRAFPLNGWGARPTHFLREKPWDGVGYFYWSDLRNRTRDRTHDIPIESQALARRQTWMPWIPDSRYSCTRFQSLSVKFGFWILWFVRSQSLGFRIPQAKIFLFGNQDSRACSPDWPHMILYRDARLHGFLGEHLFLCFF